MLMPQGTRQRAAAQTAHRGRVPDLSGQPLLDVRGVLTLYVVVSNLLSGMLIPVWWFPDWLRDIARATPFPSMLQAPADLITACLFGALRENKVTPSAPFRWQVPDWL